MGAVVLLKRDHEVSTSIAKHSRRAGLANVLFACGTLLSAVQSATADVAQSADTPQCASKQPPAYSPHADEVNAHRQFKIPAITYPFDTVLSGEWGIVVNVRINELGRATCYTLKDEWGRVPGMNAERQAAMQDLGKWTYVPFTRHGVAVPAVVSERVSEQEAPGNHVPLPEVPLEKVHISLERSGCFGSCPGYKVEIYGAGRAVYQGRGFVDVLGTHSYHVAPNAVERLVEMLRQGDIWSFRPKYVAQITDNPTYTLTMDMGGEGHELIDYVGKRVGMPRVVTEFEKAVDQAAQSEMWLHLTGDAVERLMGEHFDFHSDAGAELLARAVADEEAHDDKALLTLIELGAPIVEAKPVIRKSFDYSPGPIIETALRNRRSMLIDPLIERGALAKDGKPDQARIDSAFRAAISGGRLELVKRLWRVAGSNPHPSLTFDSVADGPMHKKAPVILLLGRSRGESGTWDGLAIAKWLVDQGCDIKAAEANGTTLLHIAAASGDAEFVRYVLSQGIDASTPGQYGLPALGSATDEDVAMVLLEAGTEMSRMNDSGGGFRRYAEDEHWLRVLAWLDAHNQ